METKKSIAVFIMFLIGFKSLSSQNIKFVDHFSQSWAKFLNSYSIYDSDSSLFSWRFYEKSSNMLFPYPKNLNYNLGIKSKDTSGYIISNSYNNNLLDDWIVNRLQINVSPNDTIAMYVGASVFDLALPHGNNGAYKPDTLEVWLSDKQLTTEPSNMNIFVGYVVVRDTFPMWQRFELPLNNVITTNKLVYLGLRHHLKNAGLINYNPAIWIDDLFVGNNPSRDLATKTEDLVVKASLKMYPNPTKDKLNIEFKNNAEKGEIKVFNIFGQVVISQNVQVAVNGIHELNVETLPKGIYFLQYGSKNQKTVSSKFVKE